MTTQATKSFQFPAPGEETRKRSIQTGNLRGNSAETLSLRAQAGRLFRASRGNSAGNFQETPSFLPATAEPSKVSSERDAQTGWTVLWLSGPDFIEAEPAWLEGDAPIFYMLERERLAALSPGARLAEYQRRCAMQRRNLRVRL